jgi:hypothetical protein
MNENTTYEPRPGFRWTYGDRVGRDRDIVRYGPCPFCGTVCVSYGFGWRCSADYCLANSNNPAPSVGPMPDWWNTGTKVFLDGNKWVGVRKDFVNLQESLAGFGDTPMAAIKDLKNKEGNNK